MARRARDRLVPRTELYYMTTQPLRAICHVNPDGRLDLQGDRAAGGGAGAEPFNAGFADATLRARIADLGSIALPGSSADFGNLIGDETEKWAKVTSSRNDTGASKMPRALREHRKSGYCLPEISSPRHRGAHHETSPPTISPSGSRRRRSPGSATTCAGARVSDTPGAHHRRLSGRNLS